MAYLISGIQQVGIGIPDVHEAWKWYRQHFGMDIPVFEEAAEANLMLPYTGGKPHQRHAVLALNGNGGGGMEIWQYTSRTPVLPNFEPTIGDYGIFVCKIKSRDVFKTYEYLKSKNVELLTYIQKDPKGDPTFFLKDPYGNYFQIVTGEDWFSEMKHATGGPSGVTIGVSDINKALKLYRDLLGYDIVVYDKEDRFTDFSKLNEGGGHFRRVLLRHRKKRKGAFAPLLGRSEIELVVAKDRNPRKIFENRFWGDRGFIHLCFDISGMDALRETCEQAGFPFTVDSANAHADGFDMGEAAGHFSYIEDPDGTLIEFVETHKVPVMKKWNWYLNLKKRKPGKELPNWMLQFLTLNRVKN